ncbi:MAG: type IV secretory system conjugative DNA transfer family protein [Thermosynechococcaceae cyanobacterium MS004]|nr:type IV secretory system conjugative DNA transfer family protein [Thermosynechococcaceae cyanobacterium MS004]
MSEPQEQSIFAKTGAGKSVMASDILLQALAVGESLVFIDFPEPAETTEEKETKKTSAS